MNQSVLRSLFFSLCMFALVAPGCGDDDGSGSGGGIGGGGGVGGGGGTGGGTGGGLGDGGALDDGGIVEGDAGPTCRDEVCTAACDATLASCQADPDNACGVLPEDGDCAAACEDVVALCAQICSFQEGQCIAQCGADAACILACNADTSCEDLCAQCVPECETRKTQCAACDSDHATCVDACPEVACGDAGV